MSFDEIITWVVILGLGFVAWKYKVQPELERRKRDGPTSNDADHRPSLKNITPIDAMFKTQETETYGSQQKKQ